MAFFWFIILIAVVFGFLGVLLKGLLWLLIIGIVLFLVALVGIGIRIGRPKQRRR
ncbi:hypothetical protein [Streptomyces sp. SID3343]|uniref:hypothetical protein n=1 Tax=Streptomyces sp. SID3343 TaxID=2690260 RepID=UPI001928A5EB|nr:hypothetical protein [Streptomyces sp. SID3343]